MHLRATTMEKVHFALLNAPYAIAALLIFVIEVLIAMFVRDGFVRPYVGDMLAVALVYCGLRAVTPLQMWPAIVVSYAIACAVEMAQFFHVVDMLGLGGNAIARTVIGTGFELVDFLAYAGGGGWRGRGGIRAGARTEVDPAIGVLDERIAVWLYVNS